MKNVIGAACVSWRGDVSEHGRSFAAAFASFYGADRALTFSAADVMAARTRGKAGRPPRDPDPV